MHACFIAVNFSIHTGGGGGGGRVRKVSTFMRRHKKFAFSGEGSKKFLILIFPIYQPPLPINNDHSLNLFINDTYDNTIKTCFIVLKQVELSAGLKWAVMTLICPC